MVKNKIAKDLRTPKYRKRVVEDKKKKENKKRINSSELFELLERSR